MDKKKRLIKLVRNVASYDEFEDKAVRFTAWYLRPYVSEGHQVTRAWLQTVWHNFRG